MSEKLRRGWTLSAAIIAAQALAAGALAQQTEDTMPRSTTDRATSPSTSTDRAQTEDRMRTQDRSQTDTSRTTQSATGDRHMAKPVTPQTFATQAAVIGKAEIELGQLAIQKSQDEDVRAYAQRMVKDHQAADAKLRKIAAKQNLSLPQTLDAEQQAVKQRLSSLNGAAFDREYKKEMAKGHDKAVALFESATQTQRMPAELKDFAASTLSTLQEHKEMAHSMHEKEGA